MRLGSKRPRREVELLPVPRSRAAIEADLMSAMQAASSARINASCCLAPRGAAELEASAVRFDHLAGSYRDELAALDAANK